MRGHFLRASLAGAVGGGDPWTPANITTALWLDADDSSTLTLSGATVTGWADKSGNGYSVSIFGNPTYSATGMSTGTPAVQLDGNGDYMYGFIANIGSKTAIDIYFVFQATAAAAANTNSVILWSYGYLDANQITGLISSTGAFSGEYISTLVGASGRLGSTTYRRAANTAQILSHAVSGAGTAMHKDGVPVTLDLAASGVTTLTDTSPAATGSTSVAIRLAAYLQSSGEVFSPAVKFAEVLVFDAIQSTADRQRIEGYLAHKWGLAANLEAGHPYKNSAPTV